MWGENEMRITNTMITNNMLYNLNKNLNKLSEWQNQMATGKLFNKPSDNPIGVSKSLELSSTIDELEQFERNADDAVSWLEVTESAVAEVSDILQRIRELAVSADGTESQDDKQQIQAEVDELKEQLIEVANTEYAGKNIFSGYKTDQELLDSDGKYNFDSLNSEEMNYEVGIGDKITVNILGHKLFGTFDGTNLDTVDTSEATTGDKAQLIAVIEDFSDALENDDIDRIEDTLGRLDEHIENILSIRGEIGAKTNRLEMVIDRIDQNIINYTELLSKNEDADMAEVIMNMKTDENIYRASLSIGANVIQPTLIDFLG